MAITIKETSVQLSNLEKYLLTTSPAIKILSKDVEDGEIIPVHAWCIFEDEKKDGECVELLSILTPDKVAYSCQSETFRNSFMDIVEVMDGEKFSIIKRDGITSAGRSFINCELDVTSI